MRPGFRKSDFFTLQRLLSLVASHSVPQGKPQEISSNGHIPRGMILSFPYRSLAIDRV